MLNFLSSSCAVCPVKGQEHCSHTLTQCAHGIANRDDSEWVDFRTNLDLEAGCCYGCGVTMKVSAI
jgi:hypothetical protein